MLLAGVALVGEVIFTIKFYQSVHERFNENYGAPRQITILNLLENLTDTCTLCL